MPVDFYRIFHVLPLISNLWEHRMRPRRSPPHLGGRKSKGAELARIDTIRLDQLKQVPLPGDEVVRSLSILPAYLT